MPETGIRGLDLVKIAGESLSGWLPSWKAEGPRPTRHPFCSLMEERLLLSLAYHPQGAWYGRGDMRATFAATYKLTAPWAVPCTIDYLCESKAHVYLPDAIGQRLDGRLGMAEAGLEQDKRQERPRVKAEAARKVVERQGRGYGMGTEATLSRTRHANLVFVHARRQTLPRWQELEEALAVLWPWGKAACVQAVAARLGARWPQAERDAAIWKRCADAAARGPLLVALTAVSLTRLTPLLCLAPDARPMLPAPRPSELPAPVTGAPEEAEPEQAPNTGRLSTFAASTLAGPQWTGSIYPWLTPPVRDPQRSGRVLMAHLMQLITTALEWSYAEAQQDVSPKPLEAAAEPLTLRRDVLYLVDASERNEQDKDRHEEPPQVSPPK